MRVRALPRTAVVLFVLAGCNEHVPVSDSGAVAPSPIPAPSPSPAPTPAPSPSPAPLPLPAPLPAPLPITVGGLALDPPALLGGPAGSGLVILTRPAPAGGAVVVLTSSDAANATVPASVTVPEGADRVGFKIATQPVPGDRNITITSSAPGGAASAALVLWSPSPTFIAWYDELGNVFGSVGIGHLTSATATFTPFFHFRREGAVELNMKHPADIPSFATFEAPAGETLHVGVYEVPPQSSAATPKLDIFGSRRGCRSFGRFEVRDIAFGVDARPVRFDATFEERCASPPRPAVRGAIRFTAGR